MHSTIMMAVFTLALISSWILRCSATAAAGPSPSALVIPPSEYFEGNDGPWSSFDLRVGTPQQDVRVLASTASPESMVVLAAYGCSPSVFTTVPSDCAVSRGNLFNPNQSSTWHALGLYGINQNGVGLEANLGYSERAEFALDNLGLGLTGPILKNQTVAGIATPEPFYLGILGLNPQPVNFSSLGNFSSPSTLTTLKQQNVIPSLSWSYTAGAKYRLKQVYGQLIFSGYDTSRFNPNTVSFTMAKDITRDLVVWLQSISYSGTTSATLLSDPISIFIDSTDPNLWLPGSVCDAFEQAFGLTLDNQTGLYLVNDTHNTQLLNSNAQVTFRLSDVSSGGDAVTVVLPYGAFALTAGPPLVNGSSHYFPLKRAANSTQYTLGRAFLQEAYLSADYERGVFNVSACSWNEGAVPNIVTIAPKDSGTSSCLLTGGCSSGSGHGSSGGSSPSLSGGAIAGIVIGSVIGAILLAAILFFCIRRQRQKHAYKATEPEPDMSVLTGPVYNSHVLGPNGLHHTSDPSSSQPSKFDSPDAVGNSLGGSQSHSHSNSQSHTDSGNGEGSSNGTSIPIGTGQGWEHDGYGSQSNPVFHELAGSEVLRTERGVRPSPLRDDGRMEEDDVGPSPIVAPGQRARTAGWQDKRGSIAADGVSPTTPVRWSGGRFA